MERGWARGEPGLPTFPPATSSQFSRRGEALEGKPLGTSNLGKLEFLQLHPQQEEGLGVFGMPIRGPS